MKQELNKLLTQYNDQGVYDASKVLGQKKKIYHSEIQFATYIDQVTDKHLGIKKLHIDFLQSMTLRDDPKFKQIKKLMQQYNEQAQQYNQKSSKGLHFKPIVMDSMLKFMRLMLLAHDTQSKKKILDVSYSWFLKNLKPSSKNKTAEVLKQEIKTIAIQQQLLSRHAIQKELPSQKIREIMKYYQGNTRTMYPQIDAPYVQIQNYNTRKVGILDPKLQEDQKNKQYLKQKWLQRVKFKRPYINRFLDEQQEIRQQNDEKNSQINENIAEGPIIVSNQELGDKKDSNQIGETNQNIITQAQKLKPTVQGQQQIENPIMDQLDFGLPGDDDQGDQQPQFEQEQKVKGKLDPFVKVFMLKKLQKQRKQQVQAQKRFQINRNKYQSQHNTDYQIAKQISEWASRKGRLKTQISKKIQSRQGIRRIVSHSLGDKKSPPIEGNMNKLRLNRTISQAKRYTGQIKDQRLNTEPSLSVYDRKRMKTQESRSEFSEILSQNTRIKAKESYLDQIEDIKVKFAKFKIYAPMNKLVSGLAPEPEDQNEKSKLLNLPIPMLPSNPFFKVGKKKKKKKKKK